MHIVVFGATGKTGQEVIKQALEKGFSITAFVRNPAKLQIKNEKLTPAQGDVTNAENVDTAVAGADAVIATLGSRGDTTPTMLTDGTKNIIDAIKKRSVRKLIIMSSYPMSGAPSGMEYLKRIGMNEDQISGMKPMLDDKVGQEKLTRESGLDWTIVRPLTLTDGEKTGVYRTGENIEVKPGDTISRADVADFLLKATSGNEWSNKTVTIAY